MERGGAQWGARWYAVGHAGARLRRGKVFSRYGRLFNSRSHDAHNSTQTIGAHAETTVRRAAHGKQAETFDRGDASCAPRGGPKDEGPSDSLTASKARAARKRARTSCGYDRARRFEDAA